jgi:hypothetical protein
MTDYLPTDMPGLGPAELTAEALEDGGLHKLFQSAGFWAPRVPHDDHGSWSVPWDELWSATAAGAVTAVGNALVPLLA